MKLCSESVKAHWSLVPFYILTTQHKRCLLLARLCFSSCHPPNFPFVGWSLQPWCHVEISVPTTNQQGKSAHTCSLSHSRQCAVTCFTHWGCLQCFQWWSLLRAHWSTLTQHISRFLILTGNTHTHRRDMKENVVVCFQGHSDALRNKTKPTKKRKLHVWHLQSCSQVTLMFCDSYDSRGQELAFPLFLPSLLSHSAAFVRLSLWCCGQLHTRAATFVCVCVCASSTVTLWFLEWGYLNMCCPYRPRSKLSTGLSAAPSSPPCSGSAAGWCPPPWSASSLWTRPPPPAAARRLQTLWTGWSTHGCCMNSSGGQNEGREGCEKRRGVTRQSGGDKKKKWR